MSLLWVLGGNFLVSAAAEAAAEAAAAAAAGQRVHRTKVSCYSLSCHAIILPLCELLRQVKSLC